MGFGVYFFSLLCRFLYTYQNTVRLSTINDLSKDTSRNIWLKILKINMLEVHIYYEYQQKPKAN
jgi:hypothetical protein